MSDHTTNGLVYRTRRLLVVPVFAGQLCHTILRVDLCRRPLDGELGVEILFLEDDFGVCHLRERNADDDYAAGGVV